MEQFRKKLEALAASHSDSPHKVQLLVARDSTISCQSSPLNGTEKGQPVRLRLAPMPVNSSSPFLYHKTTDHRVYDGARNACSDCDDVLLWNEGGEITETCVGNIVVCLDGEMVTPPVSCGLLPGTFRNRLIEERKITEGILKIDDLKKSKHIFVINSVRKWRKAKFIDG